MKTNDLIKLLQEADPTGEFEVCIENSDIERYDILPAYYDGRISVIKERDKHFRPLRTEVTGSGTKLNLFRHDWSETFIDSILDNNEEYIVDSGSGAIGQEGYNWMNADVLSRKIKMTIIAENISNVKDVDKLIELTTNLRRKYVNFITEKLTDYIKTSGHFKSKLMSVTATKLVEKCGEIGFPLEVFRFGVNTVNNRNASWIGYEFQINDKGIFFVKDSINNQTEKNEYGIRNCTQYVEYDINTFDFKKVFDEYYKKIKDSDY